MSLLFLYFKYFISQFTIYINYKINSLQKLPILLNCVCNIAWN